MPRVSGGSDMSDVEHSDSRIEREGERVVWSMSPEVAEQLSLLVHAEATRTGDVGWETDARSLLDAIDVDDDRP